MVQSAWKTAWQFLKKIDLQIPLDSATHREMKPTIHTKICAQTWIPAPLTVTKNREPPRCPPTTKRLNSRVHPHHERLLSSKKGNDSTWINLQRMAKDGAGRGWWGKPIWKPYILHDNIYRLFLSWEKDKNGEQINGCWRLRGCEEERSVAIKGQLEGSLWRWRCSVSWLYQCQYLGCEIVLQL